MSDRTNHRLYPRAKLIHEVVMPEAWYGDRGFIDVYRAGNKKDGYHYQLITVSESTFRSLWLTEQERREMIVALGGTIEP